MEDNGSIAHKLLDYGVKAALVAGTVYGISKIYQHYQKDQTEQQVEDKPEVAQAMALYSAMNPSGVEWMRKSAEEGHANGQASLGEMYHVGRGVSRDNVRAYMWHNLAAQQSLRQGGKSIQYTQRRDAIAQQLTPAQIAEAQRLSQQCQTQQFKKC